jgi:hypothetical protein
MPKGNGDPARLVATGRLDLEAGPAGRKTYCPRPVCKPKVPRPGKRRAGHLKMVQTRLIWP